MFEQMSLLDTPNSTFSPALADGPLPPALPDGQTTASLLPGPARASRSRSRAKAPELLMRGTYGPTFSESSVPDGPLSSWESRLRQRLAKVGSSECDLTWKVSGTTAEGLLSRLVPSTPRTVEIDSGLLLEADYWRTPQAAVTEPRSTVVKFSGRSPSDPQVGLPDQVVATAAYWSKPRASDGEKGGPNQAFGAGGQPLPAQAFHTAMWPTPMAGTPAQNGNSEAGNTDSSRRTVELAHGTVLDGSSATTGKRGVLNPEFPCWLMGYPIVWVFCGASAMQSLPRSRRK